MAMPMSALLVALMLFTPELVKLAIDLSVGYQPGVLT
jgi:hypothetical protein